MADWATISSLATAGGTLVLAIATFASVRSANQAARTAERSLLVGLRPVLMPSRLQDLEQKVGFVDDHWVHVRGGGAAVEVTDTAVYLVISLRNGGSGMAMLRSWRLHPERLSGDVDHGDPATFHQLTRSILVAPNDIGFMQGALRDPASEEFVVASQAINSRQTLTVDLLYTDHEGGQRTISRFAVNPREDGSWFASLGRYWNLDGAH